MNKTLRHLATALVLVAAPLAASAEDISTHVLDISNGVGAAGIPVTLERDEGGQWQEIGSASTEDNGRVEEFGIEVEPGAYRLSFDLSGYDGFEGRDDTFFPEIVVSFEVHDVERHHHVPVVVSGFGYSTYLGN